jgi:hypothetical protein
MKAARYTRPNLNHLYAQKDKNRIMCIIIDCLSTSCLALERNNTNIKLISESAYLNR